MAIHRKMTSDQDKNAKVFLEKLGMQVYVPTPGADRRVPQGWHSRRSRNGPKRKSARSMSTEPVQGREANRK
jgi:hypothetical protein